MYKRLFALTLLVSSLPALAATDVERRLERLERIVEGQGLVEMLDRVDALQRDVQRLQGLVEEQANTIEQMNRRQRELYLDLDRRLSAMERGGAAGSGGGSALVSGGSDNNEGSAASAADPAEEREAYQKAFDLLRDLRYEQAITAFRAFIKDYPNGRYAHIAQYWVGEANYARREFDAAITEYRRLVTDYPTSAKVPEALLKIGYSYRELGNNAEARKALETLTQKYPDSVEAGQARAVLRRLP